MENSNTWGSLYFWPCPRRGSGTSASRPSNGENGDMATSDSVAGPGVRHSPIRESPFLSAASVRSARVAVRTHFGPSASIEQPCALPYPGPRPPDPCNKVAMRKKGRTFSYIAEEIGIGRDVIRRELRAHGISTAPVKADRRARQGRGFWRCFD